MKRMHEFLKPELFNWQEHHTGTGALEQDGSVIYSNDDDSIAANASTVYQLDHFDADSGKYIYKLVSNQFTFPSVAAGSLKENGVKFDVDDESIWVQNIIISSLVALVKNPGLYAWPAKTKINGIDTYQYKLMVHGSGTGAELYCNGSLQIGPSYLGNGFLETLKKIFLEAGCTLTPDGYQAIIPGKYIEIVSDTAQNTVAKITILPQEIGIAPDHEPVFRLISTSEE